MPHASSVSPPARLGSTALLVAALLAGAGGASTAATLATTGTFRQTAPITVPSDRTGIVYADTVTDTAINDLDMATSTITVAAPADATVTEVSVDVSLTHENISDVDLMLVSPSGQAMTLVSDIGGGAVKGTFILGSGWRWQVSDDVGGCTLSGGQSWCSGRPRDVDSPGDSDTFPSPAPASAPATYYALGGSRVAGDWTLYAVDDTAGSVGVIDKWVITIKLGLPASPMPSALQVSGLSPRTTTDVDLCLEDLDAAQLGSVDVVLESPDGRRAHVLGGALETLYDSTRQPVSGLDLCLDDEAAIDVPQQTLPTEPSYRPHDYTGGLRPHVYVGGFDARALDSRLSVFDGADPSGTWKLWVHNASPALGGGEIGGWSLRITSTTPAPATPAPAPTTTMTSSPPAPKVLAFRPKNAQGGVRTSVSPRVVFSTDLMPASVTSESINLRTVYGRKVPVALTYDAATHTVVLDPKRHLDHRARYTVTVKTGIRDAAGTRLSRVRTATFRTR